MQNALLIQKDKTVRNLPGNYSYEEISIGLPIMASVGVFALLAACYFVLNVALSAVGAHIEGRANRGAGLERG